MTDLDYPEIKLIEMLPYNGGAHKALFQVGDRSLEIGISNSLIAVWNIQRTNQIIERFLKQFGPLKILWMLAEDELNDYNFVTYDFQSEDGIVMPLDVLDDYLKDKILEAEDK